MKIKIIALVLSCISTSQGEPSEQKFDNPFLTEFHAKEKQTWNAQHANPTNQYAPPGGINVVQNNSIIQKELLKQINDINLKVKHHHEVTLNLDFQMPQMPQMPKIPTQAISNGVYEAYETIRAHNKKLALFFVMTGYLATCYQVYSADSYSEQAELWANWRDDLSLEQLLNIPHEQLTHELLTEIQRRYLSQKNPTDFISPLTSFLNTLDNEIKYLHSYKRLREWIYWTYLSRLLPNKTKTHHSFDKQLQRLNYLKNIFLAWAAQYKLEQQDHKKHCKYMLKH